MKKIDCYQYATGRGPAGYGFIAYSKTDSQQQDAFFSFSLSKGVSLRFAQLPDNAEYVLEVEPASTDYRHAGAFLTRNRVDGGTSSIYTHVIITKDTPQEAEAFGLLKIGNFLTPDQFSEVTHATRTLEIEEKDCEITETKFQLNEEQKIRLGAFLARYWALLEQKEWSGKGTPELALILPGMSREKTIAFFANEIVPCFPEHVRPALSASFGATWNNRGSSPSVCCVLKDVSEQPFPYYNLGESGDSNARPAGAIEEKIGLMLVRKDTGLFPETYRRICELAVNDQVCGNMARGYSVMAYAYKAEFADTSSRAMRDTYERLIALAEKRYGIKKNRLPDVFLPLIQRIFDKMESENGGRYTSEDAVWMMRQNIALHRSAVQQREPDKLQKSDELVMRTLDALSLDQMQELLAVMWQDLKGEDLGSAEIYPLLHNAEEKLLQKYQGEGNEKLVRSAVDQCVRLDRDAGKSAKELISEYAEWLCRENNSSCLLKIMSSSEALLNQNDDLYFSFLEQAKDHMENMDEPTIVSFLNAAKKAGGKDETRAESLISQAYEKLMTGLSRLKDVSPEGFRVIAERILSQKQTKDTIETVFDFALRNKQCEEAAGFLKQVAENMLNEKGAEDPEYQEVLFGKLEEAAQTGKDFRLDDAIRRLLQKTNNKVLSDKTLKVCDGIKKERLKECFRKFYQAVRDESENALAEKWSQQCAEKYSCGWSELKADEMEATVRNRFSELFEESDDQTELLKNAWIQCDQKDESEYSTVVKTVITRKLETEYDVLWKKNNEERRQTLDDLVEKCAETKAGAGIREKRDNTTAGRAREFLIRLQNLSRSGMNKAPDKAGRLLNDMKEQNGFERCFRVDYQMEHKPDDDLYQLVIPLLQQIQESPEGTGYWQEPLAQLGFDPSVPVWNEAGFRMMNILAYVTQSLENMGVSSMGEDLKEYLGEEYMNKLWKTSKANEKWYKGKANSVILKPLYQWLEN